MFQRDDAAGVYGPGHNGFFTSPDGTENWIVYHANSSSGGGCGNGRTTRTQKFTWNADGTPNFGTPVADGVTPVRFSSYDFPDRYIRHWEFRAKIEPNVTNLADSQFRVVRGLAGTGTLSLESANYPGYQLHQKNNEVWVGKDDGTAAFRNDDASFSLRAGLADAASGVSFESYSGAGRYLRHYDYLLYTQPADTTLARADATFYAE